jgi:phospholipase C
MYVVPASSASTPSVTLRGQFDKHIHHIVILMMENHAFDNYFGTYCTTKGTYCPMTVNGLPKGVCVPEYPPNATPCISPFVQKNPVLTAPLPHSGPSSLASYDNGKMDGFYLAENSGTAPFGYYGKGTIPIYWDLAEEYGLGDNFYSSTLSYSLPNHWHLVAGGGPSQLNLTVKSNNYTAASQDRRTYLNEANATPTLEDLLLNHSSVSWKYYDHVNNGSYGQALGNLSAGGPVAPAFDFWDPLAAKAESYNASFDPHFQNKSVFFADAAAGTLPNVTILIPPGPDSDHPPSSVVQGEGWVASVVDSVEASPDWNSTALFITWDEYGGFYDHVVPPLANNTNARLGFRVPLLVVSPWAKEGFVENGTGYFESLLRIVEDTFKLGCLTPMDCYAPTLYHYFDFAKGPRPPLIFPTSVGGTSGASYPMPLQKNNTVRASPVRFVVPSRYDYFPNGTGPDVD